MTAPDDLRGEHRRFRAAYAEHRIAEGRGAGGERELLALPYLTQGKWVKHWGVRARTFDTFVRTVLRRAEAGGRPLTVLDLGAGNGWLGFRMAERGHRAVALDVRTDRVDGLGAGATYSIRQPHLYTRVAAAFERLPLAAGSVDLAVFNASLHYATDLAVVLREAARVVGSGGRIAVLDTPFYRNPADGEAMVAEKRHHAVRQFGARAEDLLAPHHIEYLTPERLDAASQGLRLAWSRIRVRYPMWYELRPTLAMLARKRPPSRFDVWETSVP